MGYQVIRPNTDPVYQDFMKHKIGRVTDFSKYENFYECSGLWNNYCRKSSLAEIKRLISWMCHGSYYESSDGKSLFVHGYSECDMY